MDTLIPNQNLERDLDEVERVMLNHEERLRDRSIGRCGPISIGSNSDRDERIQTQDRLSNT